MQTPGLDTLELDAQSREGIVLGLALPVLAARSESVRVFGFRPSMGVSGLSAREAARLRTLSLATSSKAIGIFEGANDFRLSFRPAPEVANPTPSEGIEADLGGHALAPMVCDLVVASFGLGAGRSVTHRLRGFTHVRGAHGQGYGFGALRALGREFGLDLQVALTELGFEPQGQGLLSITASRSERSEVQTDWKDRGALRSVRVMIGGVRPKVEQLDRLEAALRETLWETRRIEPVVERLVTAGVDLGAFLEIEVVCERGGATFTEMVARASAPLPLARRAARKALRFLDSSATFDESTGALALASAVAAGRHFELALVPSEGLAAGCALLRDIGAHIEEEEVPGLVLLKVLG